MSTFAQLNLHPKINQALNACGYTTPTPIQANSIPSILEGQDLIASAQTGTGKTAAFVLPALHRLAAKSVKKTRILILTPTRELASQITKAANTYGKFLNFNITSLVGGMPYPQQIKDLARGADIVVATPGRLIDHINSKRMDLSAVEMLILDEADRMLDMGFIEDVEFIAQITPKERQTLMFSATVDKKLMTIVKHLLKNPLRIDLSDKKIAAPQIKQELYKTNTQQHKLRLLKQLMQNENIFKAIIFSATKVNADRLATQLCDQGFAAAALHGDLRQSVRNRTVENLRRGKIQFLVATDVAARGIDIADLTHIINYDLPRFCEDYVHRIGRTGRAGKSGVAISFVLPTEMRNLQRIERYIGQRFKLIPYTDSAEHSEKSHERFDSTLSFKPDHKKPYHSDRKKPKEKSFERNFKSESTTERSTHKKRRFTDRHEYQDNNSQRFGSKPFGKKSEEKKFDREKPEGRRFNREKLDRDKPEGKRFDGEQPGKRFDRNKPEEKRFDREKPVGKRFDRDKPEGRRFNREKPEGKRFDRERSDSKKPSRHTYRNETKMSPNKSIKRSRKKDTYTES